MFLCYIGILWLNVKDCYVIAVFVVVRFVAADSYCVLDAPTERETEGEILDLEKNRRLSFHHDRPPQQFLSCCLSHYAALNASAVYAISK